MSYKEAIFHNSTLKVSFSYREIFFFWISMLKQFTDRNLETKRAPESPTACHPNLCCRVRDTIGSSWNETVKYSNLTAPNKLLLCNLWREPSSDL